MAETLLRRPLVFVAHPDDETLGCAILLQRAACATVVFATDGAPADGSFWKQYGSRERLAQVRKEEARAALNLAHVGEPHFLDLPDQQLHKRWPEALENLVNLIRRIRPTAIVTHAYEGGHPDHDTCSFIAAEARRELGLEVWETPLYHRATGEMTTQQFISGEAEVVLGPTDTEFTGKRAMSACYVSQREMFAHFRDKHELFRHQPAYDYSQPPHAGLLNYEAWQWPVTAAEVSRAFAQSLGTHA